MSAAFDVISHDILIEKMKIYGFNEGMMNWIQSYLSNRFQQVYIDGHLSPALQLEAGVPQGSILGPLLYILFTNDLPEAIHNHEEENLNEKINSNCQLCGDACCYADDTTFTKSNKDPTKLKQEIDEQYAKLSEYMDKNRLVLNKDKTHLLVMATSKKT